MSTETSFELSFDLIDDLSISSLTDDERVNILERHLLKINSAAQCVLDLPSDVSWLNCGTNLGLEHLKGKLVLLDFFTYCCINCMHILPDLHKLNQKYSVQDGLVVLGVHSAKFDNERSSQNIDHAVKRYGIDHPVVNDAQGVLWEKWQIHCWPTLVLLGPNLQILLIVMGEGNFNILDLCINSALNHYKDAISHLDIPEMIPDTKDSVLEGDTVLHYPGKLAWNKTGALLAISDTGHHGVKVVDRKGVLQHTIGAGTPGCTDGSFENAKFYSPQGLCWRGNTVYVADTENHLIRMIDLDTETVQTIAGTGEQGSDRLGGGVGTAQSISSPWDVHILSQENKDVRGDILVIAMAGLHQIWMYFIDACEFISKSYSAGVCVCLAGSGAEENRSTTNLMTAGFAQPSGVTIHTREDDTALYIADSESSTIRCVTLTGVVQHVVGGNKNPQDLFSYGDVDGASYVCKLQHPLAVTKVSDQDILYVADSYNHKIKQVDLSTNMCTSILGAGNPGSKFSVSPDEVEINEPGGLALNPTDQCLYIADTNNHCIKVYHVKKNVVSLFSIKPNQEEACDLTDSSERIEVPKRRITRGSADHQSCESVKIHNGGTICVRVNLSIPEDSEVTEGAPSACQLWTEQGSVEHNIISKQSNPVNLNITDVTRSLDFILKLPTELQHNQLLLRDSNSETISADKLAFEVEVNLYFCTKDGMCLNEQIVFNLPVVICADDSVPEYELIVLKHQFT